MNLVVNALLTRPGGSLTVLVGLLKAWRQMGHARDVTVIASVPATVKALAALDSGCRLEVVEAGSVWRRLWWQRMHLPRWLSAYQADVALANNHYLGRLPCPQVVHHHNLWRFVTPDIEAPSARRFGDWLRDRAACEALARAAANVFVSNYLRGQAERFDEESRGRNHMVPNCLDDRVVDGAPSERPAAVVEPILLAVQNANAQKDNGTLVRALARLCQLAPGVPWRLRLAGGPGRATWAPIKRLAEELGVADRIDWLGFVGPDDLRELRRSAFCFVSTSRLESSGLVLLEAMAQRCPVIASDIPAYAEYAGDAALLAARGEPEDFARAVVSLQEDPVRRQELIDRGLERIKLFRWGDWAPRMWSLLAQAADGRR